MFHLYLKDKQLKQQINAAAEFMSATQMNEANIYTSLFSSSSASWSRATRKIPPQKNTCGGPAESPQAELRMDGFTRKPKKTRQKPPTHQRVLEPVRPVLQNLVMLVFLLTS